MATAPPDHAVPDGNLLAAAGDALSGELRRIVTLVDATRQPVYKLSPSGDTRLLLSLREGLTLARRQAKAALDSVASNRSGAAVAACVALGEALRDNVLSRDNLDELDRELNEPGPGSKTAARLRLCGELEGQFERLNAAAGRLAEAAMDYSQGIDSKEVKIMDETDSETVEAIREVGVTLAAMIGGGTSIAGGRAGRRFEAVGDQMMASLDAYGLPHDGVQLGYAENEAAARAQLIGSLRRNFATRERDGFRVYYRTQPQPLTREPIGYSRLHRGSAAVTSKLLRAEADAMLGILDRLPAMVRFELSRLNQGGAAAARAAIRQELDNLVATASDPMGVNGPQTVFQFARLQLAVFDYLDEAEVLPKPWGKIQTGHKDLNSVIDSLASFRDEQVTAPTSLVRDEEVRSELTNLVEIFTSMVRRLDRDRLGERRGLAAARLELLLSSALHSADLLEADLERSGTDIAEQEIQFAGGDAGDEADSGERLSIGQFLRWARAVATPFARDDNRAAALRQSEVELLAGELKKLVDTADSFRRAARGFGLGRPAPLQQLRELAGHLAGASAQADALVENLPAARRP